MSSFKFYIRIIFMCLFIYSLFIYTFILGPLYLTKCYGYHLNLTRELGGKWSILVNKRFGDYTFVL